MPSAKLFSKMYNRGYQSRPLDKPVVSTYAIVEVSLWHLGVRTGEGRRVNVDRIDQVEALLTACVTTGRGGAPSPSSGLDLTSSGFDKGHVIALELGGVDDKLNIVPQCRFFQQSGPWRKAERDILAIIKKHPPYTCLMRVNLTYAGSPIDPRSLTVHVSNTVDGAVLYQTTLENLPTDVDVRQQDKVLDKLDQFGDSSGDDSDESEDDMDEEAWSPPLYASASFGVAVAHMAKPAPGQFQQQQIAAGNAMDED